MSDEETQEPVDADVVEESPSNTAEATQEPAERPDAADATADTPDVSPDAGDAEDFKPPASALVALDRDDAYRAMDRADEELILDEIMGRQLDVMVYSYAQGGSKITDLSYAGVAEGVRTVNARGYGHIRVAKEQAPVVEEFVQDGKKMIRVMVYAEDAKTGGGNWGTATEPQRMGLKAGTAAAKRRDGELIPEDGPEKDTMFDKFATAKALSKAQRNAMRPLLPAELVQALIAQYLGDEKRVKRIRAGTGGKIADLPPALADERAGEQLEEIRGLYEALKGISRLKLPPGKFHAYLVQSQHSHEVMDEFIAHLRALIVEAKAEQEAAA